MEWTAIVSINTINLYFYNKGMFCEVAIKYFSIQAGFILCMGFLSTMPACSLLDWMKPKQLRLVKF